MKVAQMKRAFFFKPVFIFLLILTQTSFYEMMEKPSWKGEAMRLIPLEETKFLVRKNMLVELDDFDGCGCYSDDDCRNTPGCGSFCSKNAVLGVCKEFGQVQE